MTRHVRIVGCRKRLRVLGKCPGDEERTLGAPVLGLSGRVPFRQGDYGGLRENVSAICARGGFCIRIRVPDADASATRDSVSEVSACRLHADG
jgi:hypothetical protein